MKVSYFPGCTLKNHGRNFEDSALAALDALEVKVEELERWNCCGTVFSLTSDDLIHHVATVRNLIRAKEAGSERMMTLCAMCFNTLKRSNERVRSRPDDLKVINDLMYREQIAYAGDVEVVHLLEMIRDEIGFERIAAAVTAPLKGLKVASYYGCYLVRPGGIGFDDMENPVLLDRLADACGAEAVDFPFKTECCGAYQTVDKPDVVAERTNHIVSAARGQGADVMAVSCPLCAFNLDHRQRETRERFPEFKGMPVLYFTQLLALALGCSEERLGLDLHWVDPRPLLESRGLITRG